jgi:hypothetical protein
MRIGCLLFISYIILVYPEGGFSSKNELIPLLPVMKGWSRTSEPEYYGPQNLYDYLDGGAEVYLRNNFQELLVQRYNKDDKRLSIEIYRIKTSADTERLYNIVYSGSMSGTKVRIGWSGVYDTGYLRFRFANYLVVIVSGGENKEIEVPMLEFGNQIYKKLVTVHKN